MKVRLATAEDLPAVMALIEQLDDLQRDWRVFRPRPDFRQQDAESYRRAVEGGEGLVLVAEEGGEILGTAHAEVVTPSTVSDERAVEISGVVVRQDERGRGVGRSLVEEAMRFAAERGVRWVTLKVFAANEEAIAFWRALGFTPRMLQMVAPPEPLLTPAEEPSPEE